MQLVDGFVQFEFFFDLCVMLFVMVVQVDEDIGVGFGLDVGGVVFWVVVEVVFQFVG